MPVKNLLRHTFAENRIIELELPNRYGNLIDKRENESAHSTQIPKLSYAFFVTAKPIHWTNTHTYPRNKRKQPEAEWFFFWPGEFRFRCNVPKELFGLCVNSCGVYDPARCLWAISKLDSKISKVHIVRFRSREVTDGIGFNGPVYVLAITQKGNKVTGFFFLYLSCSSSFGRTCNKKKMTLGNCWN